MSYIAESIPSQFIHYLADLKLKRNDPLKIWLDAINWSFISQLCSHLYSDIGSPAYDPVSMFKALLLIYLGQADSERDLAEKLEFDVRLQLLCGFDFFDTPSHTSFHNFRERLGSELFYDILHQLIAQAIAVGVIKKTIHTAVDSTHVWANSNKFGIRVCQCSGKCKCLRKYSDPDAQWGHKTKTYSFFGYKVHLIVDTQSQLPIEVIVTSGEVPDNTQAADLIDGAMEHHPEITITSSAMDAAYDDTDVYGHFPMSLDGPLCHAIMKKMNLSKCQRAIKAYNPLLPTQTTSSFFPDYITPFLNTLWLPTPIVNREPPAEPFITQINVSKGISTNGYDSVIPAYANPFSFSTELYFDLETKLLEIVVEVPVCLSISKPVVSHQAQ